MEALPSYLRLFASGELARRAALATALLARCTLCPRRCQVDRLAGERGFCRSGAVARVASWNRHVWEEPPISGSRGSGTIFFSGCTAACLFCQNFPISQLGVGQDVSTERLAEMMLELQAMGCHNLNLVTATHFVPQVLSALLLAIPQGFRLPLVYNTSGYESVATLRLLEDVIDIYLPDAKYASDATARRLSGFTRYVAFNRDASGRCTARSGQSSVSTAMAWQCADSLSATWCCLAALRAAARWLVGWRHISRRRSM